MALENEKDVEVTEDKVTETKIDAKEMGIEMAKSFAAEMKEAKEAKEVKTVPDKVIKAHRVEVVGRTQPCGAFKNADEMESFAKEFVPAHILEKFGNKAALSTFQNFTTDGDGASLDPIDAQGILADSVEKFPSYIEDTLQVPTLNSVSTFVDRTGSSTAYVIGETVAITQSKAEFTTRTVTQVKIAVLSPITNSLLRFGTLANIASEVLTAAGQAISEKQQFLLLGNADGDADTTDGGINSVPNTIADIASNSAEYEVTGTWSDISNDDLSKIIYQTASWAKPANYAWYCHRNFAGILEGLARTLGGNAYLVQTNQGVVPMLYNWPIKFVDQMVSSPSTTRHGLLFGDLRGCVATASTGGTFIDFSEGQWFDQDTSALRVIKHYGQNTYQPGTNGTTTSMVAVNFTSVS